MLRWALVSPPAGYGARLIRGTGLRDSSSTSLTDVERKKKHVAFAVFVTDIGSDSWRDALAVMAHGALKAAARSRHEVDLIAIAPMRLGAGKERMLEEMGFQKVLRRPVPVPAAEIQGKEVKEQMSRVMGNDARFQFSMEEEQLKYWGLSLTDYDRVLVLDADTMILDPMDELFDRQEDFIGTYDIGLDTDSSTAPPAQGGFLLFRPSKKDFEEIKRLTREGDFGGDGLAGWKRSGIGWAYGGTGPDGLLSYYYHKDALPQDAKKWESFDRVDFKRRLAESEVDFSSPPPPKGVRMLAADRKVYNLLVTDDLMKTVEGRDHDEVAAGVKSVHFTGNCVKPWSCPGGRNWLCKAMLDRWWEMRTELEKEKNLPRTMASCTSSGKYEAMKWPKERRSYE